MFEKNDKRRIYWLIDQYLSGKINDWAFCNEYHDCYDLELSLNTLTDLESKVFSKLSTIASRFSDIEKDLKKYPGTYFTKEELKQRVLEAKVLLNADSHWVIK